MKFSTVLQIHHFEKEIRVCLIEFIAALLTAVALESIFFIDKSVIIVHVFCILKFCKSLPSAALCLKLYLLRKHNF